MFPEMRRTGVFPEAAVMEVNLELSSSWGSELCLLCERRNEDVCTQSWALGSLNLGPGAAPQPPSSCGCHGEEQEGTLQRVRGVAANPQLSGDRMEMYKTSEMVNKVTTPSVWGTVSPQ